MFKSIFVARIAEQSRAVELFCRFDDGNAAASLPPDASLGGFCFPLGVNQVKPKEYMAPEEFSFTLTGGDGSRLHGFCRSFLPPRPKFKDPRTNTNLRYPQVVCVISAFPWFALYQKVLQIVEQLLKQTDILHSPSSRTLPLTSPAGAFLLEVVRTCPNPPIPGRVFRVDWPSVSCRPDISPPRRIGTFLAAGQEPFLQSTAQFIELEIPPDSGNGIWNAGIPLARLLWALPAPALMTLVASLLLERRVILTARDTDTVSACVHAAAALLYPFRWQHIYLPLLPYALKDYLTAPMPFLVGLPAHMLPLLKQLPMDEVVLVDLDLGSCEPQAGSARDDALRLPWAAHLREALQVVYNTLRSPTEYESTPIIGHLMQEYFLKVIGRYREFVQPDGELQIKAATPTSDTAAQKSHRPAAAGGPHKHAAKDDGIIRHAGHHFDHKAFVASQKRSDVARAFLDLFRHSQMFEVFMNERLELARAAYRTSDSFELKVTYVANKRSNKIGKSLVTASAKSVSNLSQMLQKTSQMVKTFRHSQSFSEEGELGVLPSFASQPGRGADAGLRGQADLPQRSQHSMSSLFRTSMTGESLVAESASGSAVPAGSLPIELAIEKPREYMLVSHQPPDQSDQWSDWAAGTKAASPPGRTSPQRQTSLLDM
ncbi:hypothetical protein WJX72_005465 [[Myrmecia] bisecta]|uniref:UDENN domain-containing protein n=1 Tax=[Myrmecia] bisecta TaxID=41462 RepID=A0AAW1R6M6_9CHLO